MREPVEKSGAQPCLRRAVRHLVGALRSL